MIYLVAPSVAQAMDWVHERGLGHLDVLVLSTNYSGSEWRIRGRAYDPDKDLIEVLPGSSSGRFYAQVVNELDQVFFKGSMMAKPTEKQVIEAMLATEAIMHRTAI